MEGNHKKILKAVILELRHMLEGYYDGSGWHAGDLEQRLNSLGVWRDRDWLPADELAGVSTADREARRVVDAYLELRDEAGVSRQEAVAEFVRETAYTWANRLLALRCMEARELIDEVILQKEVYGGRSLEHNRLAQRHPELCAGEDDGLLAVLDATFAKQAEQLPLLFTPKAPGIALKPGVAALKRAIALLSGTKDIRGQELATSEVFQAPDTFGWAYQYWNTEEKDRVFGRVRMEKGAKIEGADIIPATQLYTEPYMVKLLVQNSLGATWLDMRPQTRLQETWEYFLRNTDRRSIKVKPVREITFLDPACGSGHFLLEAFDLYYGMYEEEGEITEPAAICRSILENNLYGIDIDERAVQISEAVLWMKAAERILLKTGSARFAAVPLNLVATNIRLPKAVDHLKSFLDKHPEDKDLSSALEIVFMGLQNANELGSMLQIEGPVQAHLKQLQQRQELLNRAGEQTHFFKPATTHGQLPAGVESYEDWKENTLARLKDHFADEGEAVDSAQSFFSQSAGRGLRFFDLLAARYDVVAANPPYMGSRNMGPLVKDYVERHFNGGKRDLYAAFILRSLELVEDGGSVAMVTMNKWLHARAYAALRCGRQLGVDGLEKGPRSETNLLGGTSFRCLIDLGSRAFDPENKFHDGVQVALFVVAKAHPQDSARFALIDCTDPDGPDKKNKFIKTALAEETNRLALQSRFSQLPGAPVCYRLPDRLLEILKKAEPFGRIAKVRQGICTTADPRFVRFHWEVANGERWKFFSKGGGHKRWDGLRYFAVDWEYDGTRIKRFITDTPHAIHWSGRMPERDYYFREGWCYSRIAFGSLGVRYFRKSDLFGHTNPIILFLPFVSSDEALAHAGLLNSPLVTMILRAMTQSNDFHEGYLRRLPYALPDVDTTRAAKEVCAVALSRARVRSATDPREATYQEPQDDLSSNLRDLIAQRLRRRLDDEMIVAVCERILQALSYVQWNLDKADIHEIERRIRKASIPICSPVLPEEAQQVIESNLSRLSGVLCDVRSSKPRELNLEVFHHFLGGGTPSMLEDTSDEVTVEDQEYDEEDDASQDFHFPAFGLVDGFARAEGLELDEAYAGLVRAVERYGPGPRELVTGIASYVSVLILRLLGHCWPCDLANRVKNESYLIPITEGHGEQPLVTRVRERIAMSFGLERLSAIEDEFEEIMGKPLAAFLSSDFFPDHVSQFKKRPVAWQIQSSNGTARRKPAFALVVYYSRVNAQILVAIQSQYVRPLRQRYESEVRSIESIPLNSRSNRQHDRLSELMNLITELRSFDETLDAISRSGFGPEELQALLRRYAIEDALLCLKSRWLEKLSRTICIGPVRKWQQGANDTKLHLDLAKWIGEAMETLHYHCSHVGPEAPRDDSFQFDPTEKELACLVSKDADSMVTGALELGCEVWWRPLDEAVFAPLRAQIKEAKDELKQLKEEDITKSSDPYLKRKEVALCTKRLKESVKGWQRELDEKTATADKLKKEILAWRCSEARMWEGWLASQAMYDAISGLDGLRQPPQTVADFVSQESAYAPDINDGVRVNIAPLQKAGLLAADVLAAKDVDKAIANRAEWRADERRWCREGKLPQPGWWLTEKGHASGQN